MKPILISIIIGVGIVIVAAGFLTRDIPVERIVSEDFVTPIQEREIILAEEETISELTPKQTSPITTQNCDSSYPDVCIIPYPPDLDCGEIGYSNFRVVGSDPHGFDGDKDGIGCES